MTLAVSAETLDALAAAIDLPIDPQYRTAVQDNLVLLAQYAALVHAVPLNDREEPAFVYDPGAAS